MIVFSAQLFRYSPKVLLNFLFLRVPAPAIVFIATRHRSCRESNQLHGEHLWQMSNRNISTTSAEPRKRAAKPISRTAGPSKVARTATATAAATTTTMLSAAGAEAPELLTTPIKSESDKKSYRVIKLPNGLKALLISDPSPIDVTDSSAKNSNETSTAPDEDDEETDDGDDATSSDESDDENDGVTDADSSEKLAACALVIDVGSFSDPRDIQGLAHFLEHMIFMGSAKYPSENEFDQYIKKCGGSDNAYTNCEETQFYFEAGEPYLDGAMDRFASLFREPLMLKEAMQREREAVESEFTSKGTDDSVRREQLLASMGRPQHPSSTFTWGNMVTLRDRIVGGDDVLYERVHEFRRRHYSAHRMFVAVQARMPLDDLQALVARHWSDMPNNGLDADDFGAEARDPRSAFADEFSTQLCLMKPVANIQRLELTFCLPAMLDKYRSKPQHFLAFLIGNEATGSLCAYLRNKLYALDLVAGVEEEGFETNSMYTFFVVSVHLTQLGLDNVRHVYAACLAYIRFLHSAGPQEHLFRELQTIEETSFRFSSDSSPLENVEEYAVNLKYYPSELLMTADSLYLDYEPQQIADVLNALNSSETPLNVMLTSQSVPAELIAAGYHAFDKIEPWFGAEYAQIEVPAEWTALRSDPGEFSEFVLPAPNPFITDDFSLLYRAGESEAVPAHPQRLLDTPVVELFYRQDDRFLLPTAYYYFYLQSPAFRGSVKNWVLANMLPMLLKFRVIERLYPATQAGLGYDCYTSDKGLILRISGYNQKLHRIVETFAETLHTFADELTEEQFRTFVDQRLRDTNNLIIKPKSFARLLRIDIIEHDFANSLERFECLKTVTLTDFRAFVRTMLSEMRVQALMQGNLSGVQATDIMNGFVEALHCQPIADRSSIELRTKRLPADGRARYWRVRNMNAKDSNTVTVNYYQLGPISVRLNCLIDLLMLIAEEPCFDELRSKEQLGYDVGMTFRENNGVLGYSLSIVSQETRHSAEHCEQRIEAFFADTLAKHIADMPNEMFTEFCDTLVRLKLTADNHLRDEMSRNWAEVTAEEYKFDRVAREVDCLRSIKIAEFQDFYANYCAPTAIRRKLCVQVIGCGDSVADDDEKTNEHVLENEVKPVSILEKTFAEPTIVDFADGHGPDGAKLIRDFDQFRSGLERYPVCKTGDSLQTVNIE